MFGYLAYLAVTVGAELPEINAKGCLYLLTDFLMKV